MKVEINMVHGIDWLEPFTIEFPARLNIEDELWLFDIVPIEILATLTGEQKDELLYHASVFFVGWYRDGKDIYQSVQLNNIG